MATYNVLDLAEEIYFELSEPSDISVSFISTYVRNNIGNLNNLLGTSLSINQTSLDFDSDLGEGQKVIFKQMFAIYYVDKLIRDNLGAAAFTSLLEVTSDGATVRRTDRNSVAKSYMTMRKDLRQDLDKLVNGYKLFGSAPKAVHGDDYLSYSESSSDDFTIVRYPRVIQRIKNL